MRALLVLVLFLALAAPAGAQLPCGLVEACPTPTPKPYDPSEDAPYTPPQDPPFAIVLGKLPKVAETGRELTVRGRVTGLGADAVARAGDLVTIVPYASDFGVRQSGSYAYVGRNGRFSAKVIHDVRTRYSAVIDHQDQTVRSEGRTVRATARLGLRGEYSENGKVFEVFFGARVPAHIGLVYGVKTTGGFPRRAYLYIGTGRRLRRVASTRMRRDLESIPPGLYASFRIRVRRLPRRRFRYIACYRGPGARGLTPLFRNCGAKHFIAR